MRATGATMPDEAGARDLPQTIYHVVDSRNWPRVEREGLRPASALAAACLPRSEAAALIRRWRRTSSILPSGVVLRDQRPMPATALERCLATGVRAEDWYEIVNDGVYFWVDPDRLERHLRAQTGTQFVLQLDGPALARAYSDRSFMTPFNVGAARRRPAPRGRGTFVPYPSWRRHGWRDESPGPASGRRSSHPPAEFVIRGDIPDAMSFVHGVVRTGA